MFCFLNYLPMSSCPNPGVSTTVKFASSLPSQFPTAKVVFFVQEPPASGQTGKVQFSQRGLSRRKILASEDLPDPVAPRMTMCGGGSSKLKPVFLKKGYSEF